LILHVFLFCDRREISEQNEHIAFDDGTRVGTVIPALISGIFRFQDFFEQHFGHCGNTARSASAALSSANFTDGFIRIDKALLATQVRMVEFSLPRRMFSGESPARVRP